MRRDWLTFAVLRKSAPASYKVIAASMDTPPSFPSVSTPFPDVRVIENLKLTDMKRARIDGRSFDVKAGAWAFYVPKLNMKILHAVEGRQTCLRKVAQRYLNPSAAEERENALARENGSKVGPYLVREWDAALTTPVAQRVAETWIAACRLAKAGLGPQATEIVVVKNFQSPYSALFSTTAGFVQANAKQLPKGPSGDEAAMRAAGVEPDRIKSCIRQPINGYITDLNSVVGVKPLDADAEIATLMAYIDEKMTT